LKSRNLLGKLAALPEAVSELLADSCGTPRASDQTDGLRLCFENGEIVHFRASGNAPELRCYAEADTPEKSCALVWRIADICRVRDAPKEVQGALHCVQHTLRLLIHLRQG
jgi:phosphomannomutase